MTNTSAKLFDAKSLATKGAQVPEWIARPFQLVSLFEMYQIDGNLLFRIARGLETIVHHPDNTDVLSEDDKVVLNYNFDKVLSICKELGLNVSAIYVEDMKERILKPDFTHNDVKALMPELLNRIRDELKLALLMHIPHKKAEFYTQPSFFGQEVGDSFPSATLDIEEAGKCYATGRNTATVMHLMRVMEVGLRVTAKGLGLPDPTHANWQNIIDKINKEISQKTVAKTPDWLKVEPFYSAVSAQLHAVKTAWRNPVMHVHSTYDEERALDIFNAVKGFMRHLATELKE